MRRFSATRALARASAVDLVATGSDYLEHRRVSCRAARERQIACRRDLGELLIAKGTMRMPR